MLRYIHTISYKFAGPTAHWRVRSSATTHNPPAVLDWGVYPPYPPETILAREVKSQRWPCLLFRPLASPGWPFGPPGPPLAAPRDPRGPLGPHLATPPDPLDSSLLGGTLRALLDNFPKISQWRYQEKLEN